MWDLKGRLALVNTAKRSGWRYQITLFAPVSRSKTPRFRSFRARKTLVCARLALEKTSFSLVWRSKNIAGGKTVAGSQEPVKGQS
jgi:hypothetical protein